MMKVLSRLRDAISAIFGALENERAKNSDLERRYELAVCELDDYEDLYVGLVGDDGELSVAFFLPSAQKLVIDKVEDGRVWFTFHYDGVGTTTLTSLDAVVTMMNDIRWAKSTIEIVGEEKLDV